MSRGSVVGAFTTLLYVMAGLAASILHALSEWLDLRGREGCLQQQYLRPESATELQTKSTAKLAGEERSQPPFTTSSSSASSSFFPPARLALEPAQSNFYANVIGRKRGVYDSWKACHEQVNGFKGNCYKGGFSTYEAAERWRVAKTVEMAAIRRTF